MTCLGSPGIEVESIEPDTYEVVPFRPEKRRSFALYRGDQAA